MQPNFQNDIVNMSNLLIWLLDNNLTVNTDGFACKPFTANYQTTSLHFIHYSIIEHSGKQYIYIYISCHLHSS